jgi:hypothetical protein
MEWISVHIQSNYFTDIVYPQLTEKLKYNAVAYVLLYLCTWQESLDNGSEDNLLDYSYARKLNLPSFYKLAKPQRSRPFWRQIYTLSRDRKGAAASKSRLVK